MEENKYYVPGKEEFYIGFEFEILESAIKLPGSNKIWIKRVFTHIDILLPISNSLEFCRVKYLNKEDIEAEGFRFVKPNSKEKTFIKASELIEGPWFHAYKDNLRLSFNESEPRVELGLEYVASINVLFRGTIKNKSEFKKILKMIGI